MARRRGRARGIVGGITKAGRTEIEGFDELVRNLRRLSVEVRLKILNDAVDQGAEEAHSIMEQLAPRGPGAGARGYHGADRLINVKHFSRRDSRSKDVGIGRQSDGAWFLKFAETGTIFSAEQPFIKPTARAMRKRMIDIVIQHWRKAVRKGIR